MVSRRKLLRAGSGVLLGSSLAGCGYLEEDRSTSISVHNHTQERESIRVTVFDTDSDTQTSLFTEEVELAPTGENANTERFQDAFTTQRVLVEVTLGDMQEQFTYRPSPACTEDGRDEHLTIQFNNPYSIRWSVACQSE